MFAPGCSYPWHKVARRSSWWYDSLAMYLMGHAAVVAVTVLLGLFSLYPNV